jgi:hypothetical protein
MNFLAFLTFVLVEGGSQDSAISIATGWMTGFDFRQGQEIILYPTAFRLILGPMQPHKQWVPGILSLGLKWLRCEADCSPPSSAKTKNDVVIPPLSPHILIAWCLIN